MQGISGVFDASQFTPKQVGASVPPGKYPFQITMTSVVPTKANDGGMFVVEFGTPSGAIAFRYNLWNKSEQAVNIANGQLSALCHATGIFKLDWDNEGAALRGARGMIEVGLQKGEEEGGYTEIKKVLDANGNEPGKAPAAAPQPAQSWGAPQSTSQPAPQGNGGWGATQPAATNLAPAAAPQGWQPGPSNAAAPAPSAAPGAPPWAR